MSLDIHTLEVVKRWLKSVAGGVEHRMPRLRTSDATELAKFSVQTLSMIAQDVSLHLDTMKNRQVPSPPEPEVCVWRPHATFADCYFTSCWKGYEGIKRPDNDQCPNCGKPISIVSSQTKSEG